MKFKKQIIIFSLLLLLMTISAASADENIINQDVSSAPNNDIEEIEIESDDITDLESNNDKVIETDQCGENSSSLLITDSYETIEENNHTIVNITTTVFNNGGSDEINISLNRSVFNNLIYIGDDSNGAYNNTTGLWNVGDLKSGESKFLTITTILERYYTHLYPPYSIDSSVSKNIVSNGEIITYIVNLTNPENYFIPEFELKILFPQELIYLNDDSNGTYDPKTCKWTINELILDKPKSLKIQALVNSSESKHVEIFRHYDEIALEVVSSRGYIDFFGNYHNQRVSTKFRDNIFINSDDGSVFQELIDNLNKILINDTLLFNSNENVVVLNNSVIIEGENNATFEGNNTYLKFLLNADDLCGEFNIEFDYEKMMNITFKNIIFKNLKIKNFHNIKFYNCTFINSTFTDYALNKTFINCLFNESSIETEVYYRKQYHPLEYFNIINSTFYNSNITTKIVFTKIIILGENSGSNEKIDYRIGYSNITNSTFYNSTFYNFTIPHIITVINMLLGGKESNEKIDFKINAKALTSFDSNKNLRITLLDEDNAKLKNVDLCVKVIIDKKSKSYTLTTDSNGLVNLKLSGLPVGSYKVFITSLDDKYSLNKQVTIKVNKIKTLVKAPKITGKFKKSRYFKIVIKNKATKKPISRLKVKIKVYTGKKYKTYIVKTNKKGLAKINTKNLKKGKHKVVITSGNENYYISAKSLITIKK